MKIEDIKKIQEVFREEGFMKAFAKAQAEAMTIENEKIRMIRIKERHAFLKQQSVFDKSKKEQKEFEFLTFLIKFDL